MKDIQTDRLVVRAFEEGDIPAFTAVTRSAFGGTGEGCGEQVRYFELAERVHEQLKQPPYGDRAVVLKGSGELIGAVGFVPCLAPFGQLPGFGGREGCAFTPEVGLFWAVHRDHQRRGYATEAAEAMIGYALDELRVGRLVATTERDNLPSIGVMKKLQMRVERNPFATPEWFQVVGVLERR